MENNKIAFLATDGYEDLELHYPWIRLLEANFKPELIGLEKRVINGKHGYPVSVDLTIDEVSPDNYLGVVIPGGVSNPDSLRRNGKLLEFVKNINVQNKLVAAICHAGWVLISAKVLKGRKATSYYAIKDDMINAGVDYLDKSVVIDGNLITSRSPADLPDFMKAILSYLDDK